MSVFVSFNTALPRWEIEKDLLEQGVLEGEVILKTETPLAQNWETFQWPDGLGFGTPDTENLYYVTARAQLYHNGKMDFTGGQGANYRIGYIYVGDISYLRASNSSHFPHIGIIG